MRIKKLELKNFRGFEDLTIDFPEGESGLAVFVGVNGSGKTSVLEGVNSLLLTFQKSLQAVKEKAPLIPVKYMKNGATFSNCKVVIDILGVDIFVENEIKGKGPYVGFSECTPSLWAVTLPSPPENWNWNREDLIKLRTELAHNIPIIKFFPTERSVSESPSLNPKDLSEFAPFSSYHNSLSKKVDFKDLFEWFRSMEDSENERRLFNDNNYRDFKLEAVRNAISSFLPNFKKLRVRRQPIEELIVEKNGNEFSISKLSHGEKLLIAIVSEITRILAIANPESENPLLGHGVVLIDEIEQHLHPAWQRTIIPNLRRTFPNIQFILTTHSPQVISTLQKENVFILDNFQLVKDTPHTYGRDSNSILYDIFGVEKRPREAKEEFAKLYRLMDDPEKVTETANLLHDAEAKYGYYDEEVMRAREQFKFLNEA